VLADLVEADGSLPEIQPGVLMDGDDLGKWLQQQKQLAVWARLLPEQQERLSTLGVKPVEEPSPGLAALAQWVEREGSDRPVPRGHAEEIAVDGETEPVVVKLGVWISNTKSRRDKLTVEQRNALRELGVDWA
jgi:hypothetical protein